MPTWSWRSAEEVGRHPVAEIGGAGGPREAGIKERNRATRSGGRIFNCSTKCV